MAAAMVMGVFWQCNGSSAVPLGLESRGEPADLAGDGGRLLQGVQELLGRRPAAFPPHCFPMAEMGSEA